MKLYAHDTQQTTVCVFWDAYQILGNDTHWMLPHLFVIFELLSGLDIVVHGAIVLWVSDVSSRELDPIIYSYLGLKYHTEQQINGAILPFLM